MRSMGRLKIRIRIIRKARDDGDVYGVSRTAEENSLVNMEFYEAAVGLEPAKIGLAGQRLNHFGIATLSQLSPYCKGRARR